MARLPRFGTAVSAVALATLVAGCAGPLARTSSAAKASNPTMAYGMRAQMALSSGDFASAIDFAEKAVEKTPGDASVRMLLANSYFAAGRFASAETAYRDALAIGADPSQAALKFALVQIAQGKTSEAMGVLESSRNVMDAADYGLALALAGQPMQAIDVLEPAARSTGADSRVRQNLALAYGLMGDWTAARTIAEQDVPGDQVDARIQQWMALAKPVRASDQVASLIGISPAASDPGQPVQLALVKTDTRVAQAAPAVQPEMAMAAPVAPQPEIAMAAPMSAPVEAAPVAPVTMAAAPMVAPEAPSALMAFASRDALAPAPKPAPRKASSPARKPTTVANLGKSSAVVQLGAYSSPERVSAAWDKLKLRYPALRDLSPMRAKFDGPKGTVYRLSVKGFASQQAAQNSCSALKSRGGNCFVRTVAGDAPVQMASR